MKKTLTFETAHKLAELYANRYENLELAEEKFGVELVARDGWLTIEGVKKKAELAEKFFDTMCTARKQGLRIGNNDFRNMLDRAASGKIDDIIRVFDKPIIVDLKRKSIVPKNINQKNYLKAVLENDVVFGVGPAGTGKTYLAVAAALKLLRDKRVERVVLTRPAVEAGEALGFLPGDLQEKLLPYLRPLYDAMNDMLGAEETLALVERQIVEIAPLAYMRGRTLSNAFVILDEAQNTSHEQMMMFLTRLGENSKMAITGDITQIDLPRNKKSGLVDALETLDGVDGVKIFRFDAGDVIRHPLVTKIVAAYDSKKQC
ncbi:MAG: PhoH family protein [Candidatus Merdousia sp.]|nr:PhoH family protein [Candidatus Merdousia sp.]